MASNGTGGLPSSTEARYDQRPILWRFREQSVKHASTLQPDVRLSAHNDPQPVLKAAAAEMIEMRRRRERMLSSDLVDGPAWEMLLHAYVSPNRVMMAKELVAAAPVPQTTAFRWLQHLENEGFLQRTEHPSRIDNRATFYRLTAGGRANLERVLEEMLRE